MRVEKEYDIVVCGGGMAGVCAALAANRHGARTALVQDRPVLGGNASSEIRVHISGADAAGRWPNRRETGIIEELLLENRAVNHGPTWDIWDQVLLNKVRRPENLDLFLNTIVDEVEMVSADSISAVLARETSSGRCLRLKADFFIDCSGDGCLAYQAGAEYRYGREARKEFNESLAPEVADTWTMGASILYTARDLGRSVPFEPPPGTLVDIDWDKMTGRDHSNFEYGFWWIEVSHPEDNIIHSDEIRKELTGYVYSFWNHIKNSGTHKAETWVLDWIGVVPGKRESRRFMGDYILTENDLRNFTIFKDRVAYAGWPIDIHNPGGIKDPSAEPFTHDALQKPVTIPWRILYSRNIINCLFAGRNISTTHVGMGPTRVQATCAIMGQAAGTGAALCLKRKCNPKDITTKYISELQQLLLRDDCYIPEVVNTDSDDRARIAKVKTSSEKAPALAAKVINGLPRDIDHEIHHWDSGELPAWLELEFPEEIEISKVEIKFDSNLSKRIYMLTRTLSETNWHLPRELACDYKILNFKNNRWDLLHQEENNYLRFRSHKFKKIRTTKIRLEIETTHGCPSARVFEIRVY